jgi:lipopolysaccharide exporter
MKSAKKVLIGSSLLIGQSLSTKLIGLVSTLILARVLVPEDFGLVAIATLCLGFVEVLSKTGSMQYLISVDEINDSIVNSAWTLDFIIKIPLAIIFAISAPLIANFYGDDRLIAIIYTLSFMFLLRCIATPAESLLRRAQNFYPLVKLGVLSKIISVTVTVTLALGLKSYWALILGQFVSAIISTLGSYLIHSHRPRFTLINIKDQWKFSSWMIPQSVVGFFRTQLDTLIVSATSGQNVLGAYHIMKYLAYIPSAHIILPATEPLLVELRKARQNTKNFSDQFNISFIVTMAVALPIVSIMYVHHRLIVSFLLGSQWVDYSMLLAIFGFTVLAMAFFQQAQRVLLIFGKTKQIFYYEVTSFIGLYSVLFFVGVEDIFIFSMFRVGIDTVASLTIFIYIAIKYTGLSNFLHLTSAIIPIILASIAGALISNEVKNLMPFDFINLVIVFSVFFSTFILTIIVLYIMGPAKTIEFLYLKNIIIKLFNALRKRLVKD